MKVVLQPIQHRPGFELETAAVIVDYFRETVFQPVGDLLEKHGIYFDPSERVHARDALVEAITSGTVEYDGDEFSGKFNADITRRLRELGATWRPARRVFWLPADRIPYALRGVIADRKSKTGEVIAALIALFLLIMDNMEDAETGMVFRAVVDKTETDLQKQFAAIVAGVKGMRVPAVPDGAAQIWAGQLKDRIDALAKAYLRRKLARIIARLRLEGARLRLARLTALLRYFLGVFRRYAEMLARNELGRGVADHTENFARSIGSQSYVWATMRDWRVRPTPDYPLGDHRSLEGTTQLWTSPPVTIPGTGHTAHPGQDINCRCRARIVINVTP